MTDYITPEELFDFMSLDGNFELGDLQPYCTAASRAVDSFCRDRFYPDLDMAGDPDSVARVFWPTSSLTTFIDYASDVAEVALDLDGDGTYEDVWDATDWYTLPLNGIGSNGEAFPAMAINAAGAKVFSGNGMNRPPVQVTAVWGWATVPPAVAQAALLAGKDMWTTKDERAGLIAIGEFVAVARRNPMFLSLLQPYRRKQLLVA